MAKRRPTLTKVKKKRWVPIIAPKVFNEVVMGESLVQDPESLIGRHITVNLMNLTNDIKKQNVNLRFEMNAVQGGNMATKPISYTMMAASLKRLVRRGKSQVSDSFVAKSADNLPVRIKPIIITRNKTSGLTKTQLRNNAKEIIIRKINKLNFDAIINDIVSNKLQRELKTLLNKIYPIKIVEIKAFGVERRKNFKLETAGPEKIKPVKSEKKPAEKNETSEDSTEDATEESFDDESSDE